MTEGSEKADVVASRVVLSYPADLSDWGRSTVEGTPFRAYLRKAHESVAEGDRWDEFVGVGCCGDSLDVPLVVEQIEGGSTVRKETAFAFVERDGCAVAGGWQVQSADGPSR